MTDGRGLQIGGWARAGTFVGLVAALRDDEVALFDPAERRTTTVAHRDATPLPAGAVTVTVSVDLPVAHGVDEAALRRWVAALTDDTLRERAYTALADAGLDEGAALPAARMRVDPVSAGTVCLCGAREPGPPGAAVTCGRCGRLAVGPPVA